MSSDDGDATGCGEEEMEYYTRVAPQSATDILIQIVLDDRSGKTIYHFHLGECISEWIDSNVNLAGILRIDDCDRQLLLRGALHLERHARLIRDDLTGPCNPPEADDACDDRKAAQPSLDDDGDAAQ